MLAKSARTKQGKTHHWAHFFHKLRFGDSYFPCDQLPPKGISILSSQIKSILHQNFMAATSSGKNTSRGAHDVPGTSLKENACSRRELQEHGSDSEPLSRETAHRAVPHASREHPESAISRPTIGKADSYLSAPAPATCYYCMIPTQFVKIDST